MAWIMTKQQQYQNSLKGLIEELEMRVDMISGFTDEQINDRSFRSAYTDLINAADSLLNVVDKI